LYNPEVLPHPLGLIFFASFSNGQRVFKDSVVGPKLQFLLGRLAREQIKNAADKGFLLRTELNAWSCSKGFVLNDYIYFLPSVIITKLEIPNYK
jgi:hypothetical protein